MLALTPNIAHPSVGSGPTFVSDMLTLRPMQDWAVKTGLQDARRALIWDSGQPVIELGVGTSLVFTIMDSGAHQTIMSSLMATGLVELTIIRRRSGHKNISLEVICLWLTMTNTRFHH